MANSFESNRREGGAFRSDRLDALGPARRVLKEQVVHFPKTALQTGRLRGARLPLMACSCWRSGLWRKTTRN
jgi:hypothetical protein